MTSRPNAGCFSWRAILVFAALFDGFATCVAYACDYRAGMHSRLGNAMQFAIVMGVILAMGILSALIGYKLIEAVFRLNRPKFGPPPSNLTNDPFAGWSGRDQEQ